MPAMDSSRFLFCLFPILFLMINQALGQVCNNENGNYTTNSAYQTNLNRLLSSLPSNENGNGYGFYNASYRLNSSNEHIYAIGLCRGDVQAEDCSSCLNNSIYAVPQLCPNQKEAIGWYDNCMLRYSNRSIYGIIIVVPILASLVLVMFMCICLRVRKAKKKFQSNLIPGEDADEIESAESLQFSFDTIRIATVDFSEANKLGQGGFGSVYKGRLLNGEEIAVKRLSVNSGQGDLEFKNEVLLVAKLQHRNLVRLLGFCLEGVERLLIYEFVPNASLDHIIFDPIKRAQLDWDRRYKIIVGITRGLIYLHEDSRLRIIHRDLKASNILIDEEMSPKISDFGMAKLFGVDQTQGNTSRIVGTYGYMAPEYAMHGHFSVKSDVYSFGVLVLEIVSGQKNNSFRRGENVEDLLSYAWKCWREETASNLIDLALMNGSRNEIMRCIHIGLLCVQENIADRPTMNAIVLMLNSYSVTLPVPSQPAFLRDGNVGSDMTLGWKNSSEVITTGSDRSKSSSVKAPEHEVSLITEVYPR
ncbi:hypothetical protein ACFX15_036239 [Malus domestica]